MSLSFEDSRNGPAEEQGRGPDREYDGPPGMEPDGIIESNWDYVVDNFDDMSLREELLRGIYAYGFEKPSAIQQRAIIPCIKGLDVIAQAQSGTGKTATFSIAILQKIDTSLKECQALILAPTRELAQQDGEKRTLVPFHSQTLPANTKVALLADVDGDGELELVLGLTDHVLRTYRWVGIGQDRNDTTGKLVGLHKWEFAEQIGSISLNPCPDGSPYVLVAQPGGTYINFQCSLELAEDVTDKSVLQKLTPKHHPLASSRMRNPNISSEILGGIHGVHEGRKKDDLIAVATLDGTLMLVDGDDTIWSLQVDHQLFAITKLDLTGNGEEEVIACAWGGQTYIVDQQRQSVRFKFDDPVCTFTSGLYSVESGKGTPALVYGTFCDRICLYYDVRLPFFRVRTLGEAMEEHPEGPQLLARFPVEASDLRRLYSMCLYEFPSHLKQEEDT